MLAQQELRNFCHCSLTFFPISSHKEIPIRFSLLQVFFHVHVILFFVFPPNFFSAGRPPPDGQPQPDPPLLLRRLDPGRGRESGGPIPEGRHGQEAGRLCSLFTCSEAVRSLIGGSCCCMWEDSFELPIFCSASRLFFPP